MTIQLTFTISLHSDYHISAGHGLGALLDSALQRDADGIPVVRGTTVTGPLRSGFHALATHTALGKSAQWQNVLLKLQQQDRAAKREPGQRQLEAADLLFGAPWQQKHWYISSARPIEAPTPQQPGLGWRSGETGAQAATHVRVDPATRRAEANKLFTREEGDERLQFQFTVTCYQQDDIRIREALLLVAAARMVEAIGANRRRGRGHCAIQLTEVKGIAAPDQPALSQNDLLNLFQQVWLEAEPLPPHLVQKQATFQPATPTNAPLRLFLLLRTDEPVLFSKRAAAGNQFEAHDYLPGVALRGAFAGRMNRHAGTGDALGGFSKEIYQRFVELFYRGRITFTPAYPAIGDGEFSPTIPAPRDLFLDPAHGEECLRKVDIFMAKEAAAAGYEPETKGKSTDVEPFSGYIALDEEGHLINPVDDKVSEMHVTIDEKSGRARDQELFGYVTLPAGRYFACEMIFTDKADWQDLQQLAVLPELNENTVLRNDFAHAASPTFQMRLGKANRRGYGRVTCSFFQAKAYNSSLWEGAPIEQRVVDSAAPLTLTLLSDAILIDRWGRAIQHFDTSWLKTLLNLPVEVMTVCDKDGTEHTLQYTRTRIIDSFNNHLGLPRHRDFVMIAGSAVTLQFSEAVSPTALQARLKQLEQEGIGLRRNEGFGRIVFNHPLYQAMQNLEERTLTLSDTLKLVTTTDDPWLAEQLWLEKTWKETIDSYPQQWQRISNLSPGRQSMCYGLAVALQSKPPTTLAQAEEWLQRYGNTNNLPIEGLEHRDKKNWFAEADGGKFVITLLNKLFAALAGSCQSLEDDIAVTRWETGARAIAQRLAEALDVATMGPIMGKEG